MVMVNDAYAQAKWEAERAIENQSRHRQAQPEPEPVDPLLQWMKTVNELIRRQNEKDYKKAWVVFTLLAGEVKPPMEVWRYLEKHFNYRSGWSFYKYHQWLSAAERKSA